MRREGYTGLLKMTFRNLDLKEQNRRWSFKELEDGEDRD